MPINISHAELAEIYSEIKRLRASNARLLAALKECANGEDWLDIDAPSMGLKHLIGIAKAAIAVYEETKP